MLNILRIFMSDAKRLYTNVVAVVVIIGLSVIPCLYAWFNILSNWAPYEEEATGNLTVAVVSEDMGIELKGFELNIGDKIVSGLKENKSINWVFAENSYEAIDGAKSGDYYAAFVIPGDFSKNMISFLGGDPVHPTITYYENEKKNAIAPKITGKVKTTIQKQVNSTFVSTLAESMVSVGGYLKAGSTGSVTDTAVEKLETLESDLNTAITIMNSYIALIETSENLMTAADKVGDELDLLTESARSLADSADVAVDSAKDLTDTASDLMTDNLSNVKTDLSVMRNSVDKYAKDVDGKGTASIEKIDELYNLSKALSDFFDASTTDLDYNEDLANSKKNVENSFSALTTDLYALKTSAENGQADSREIYDNLSKDLDSTEKAVDGLSDSYKKSVKPDVKSTMTSLSNSINQVKSLLSYSSDSLEDVSTILSGYPDLMGVGKDNLIATRDDLVEMKSELLDVKDDIKNLDQNDQYAMLLRLLDSDPEQIADFISEPVGISSEAIFPVENNGSAMAAFYVVLSIWVGSLILVAVIHTKVKPIEGVENMKTYQEFFGRYIVFFLIGQIQTIITVLGALLYVGIQCVHPFLFYFAMAITSWCYTLLMYSLAYAFEAVGEAIAVVLMVIQVAGAGGTFPIEVLPVAYQVLYKYMPFAYSISAARESIAGTYEYDYWKYLSALGIYIVISLVIGLFVSIPCKKMNAMIKESTEKTDLMK